MALLEIRDYSFTYAGAARAALRHIDLTVEAGQWVLLCGPAGSGKSTLLAQLKPMVAPLGQSQGSVRYAGSELAALSMSRQAQEIGLVMQHVDNQLVMEYVWQELAFPLENLGLHPAEMRSRVAELASAFELTPLLKRRLTELSGGQRQLINLASVLIMRPQLLLLDEPLAQLDPVMSRQLLHMLAALQEEWGLSIIMAEHHLEAVLPLAERVVVLSDGAVAVNGDAAAACRYFAAGKELRDYAPPLAQLYWQVEGPDARDVPLTVRQGRAWAAGRCWQLARRTAPAAAAGEAVLSARDVYYRYDRRGPDVLRALSLSVRPGQRLAILGGNGSGKSTLLKALFGALLPQQGSIHLLGRRLRAYRPAQLVGRLGYLPQDPEASFWRETVADELTHRRQQLGPQLDERFFDHLVRRFDLEPLLPMHPYDLSGGQQQRLALFLAICARPAVLLLDEPTRGLDPQGKAALAQVLDELCGQGLAVVMVTHDLAFAADWADGCGLLFQGELSDVQPTAQFFAGKHFYTTTINKVFGQWLPQAIKASDVQAAEDE